MVPPTSLTWRIRFLLTRHATQLRVVATLEPDMLATYHLCRLVAFVVISVHITTPTNYKICSLRRLLLLCTIQTKLCRCSGGGEIRFALTSWSLANVLSTWTD